MSPLLQTFGSATARGYNPGLLGASSSFELIQTQTLASNVTSVTFSSIPTTYKHLQVRIIAKNSGAQSTAVNLGSTIRFNGATSGYYNSANLYTFGGNAASGYLNPPLGNGIFAASSVPGNTTANIFGACIVDIFDYLNTTKNKTAMISSGMSDSQYQGQFLAGGVYLATTAVSSITMVPVENYVTGSRFSLYGIKG